MLKTEKLTAKDHDALLSFYNTVFGRTGERDFTRFLPVMWRKTDEAMGKNIAIRKDGDIIAAMGVYPLNATVCGRSLRFATTGNIAVAAQYRGQGLMKELMAAAFAEPEAQNIDAARLGGERLRYNRYGYEFLGQNTVYTLTAKNLPAVPETEGYTFTRVMPEDTDALAFIRGLITAQPVFVDRGSGRDLYDVMTAFYSELYLVTRSDHTPVGALAVSPDHTRVYDHYAADPAGEFAILCAYLRQTGGASLRFSAPPWAAEFHRAAGAVCENCTVEPSTQCKILHWDKLIGAFSALRNASLPAPPAGSAVVEITGAGRFFVDGTGCRMTDETPDLTLDALTATRLFFGHQPPQNVCPLPENLRVSSLFPLPFWWNDMDRV